MSFHVQEKFAENKHFEAESFFSRPKKKKKKKAFEEISKLNKPNYE